MDVIVVGAGLFGSVCGRWAELHGQEVAYVDEERAQAGSPASAGLIKPSWLQGFGDAGRIGLEALALAYGLEDLTFRTKPLGARVKVHYINPHRVMAQDAKVMVHARVSAVGDGWVRLQGGEVLTARKAVLVATGVWAQELVPNMPKVRQLAGSAFLFNGTVVEPRLEMWAPYKQIKVFNRAPGVIWTGDSTGMDPSTYTTDRSQQSLARCLTALEDVQGTPMRQAYSRTIQGLRPVVDGYKQGYFARVHPRTWVATGGGKMGSVLAGYMATRFLSEALR